MISDKTPYSVRKTTVRGSWQFVPFLPFVPSPLLWSILSLLCRTHRILEISHTVQRTVQKLRVNSQWNPQRLADTLRASSPVLHGNPQDAREPTCSFVYLKITYRHLIWPLVAVGGTEPALTIIALHSSSMQRDER